MRATIHTGLCLLLCLLACQTDRELVVFAAVSLTDALIEVGDAFHRETGSRVRFNFAGSNELARQIAAGAPADLFLSADLAQSRRLEDLGKLDPRRRVPLLGNRLVVVVPAGREPEPVGSAQGLLAFDRLAIADPAAVPAGVYARQWLERVGLWQELRGRVVPTLDVRAALAAVASGDLPAGVVYATDAATSRRVVTVYRVPKTEGPEIRYYLTPLTSGRHAGTESLHGFLRQGEAARIFQRHGLLVLASDEAARESPIARDD